LDNAYNKHVVAVLLAAVALATAHPAPPYTIRLDRLLAPTVNGHQIANERDAARIFGQPATRTSCTAHWPKLTLDTCRTGVAITATAPSWQTAKGLHPGDTAARAHSLYPQGRSLDFLNRGALWQLETGGAMCDGGPTLALAAKLVDGRVAALEVVRVPACG
jgi:hypothetical protein